MFRVHHCQGYAINKNRASEWQVSRDGDYTFGLVEKAQVVDGSDFQDSNLCPQVHILRILRIRLTIVLLQLINIHRKLCRPHLMAYATEMKSTQLHATPM